jgi:hypothetical protein
LSPDFFCETETLLDVPCTLKAGIFSFRRFSLFSASALTNGEETTDSIISKMLSN